MGDNRSGRRNWIALLQTLSMLLVVVHHSVPHGYAGPTWLLALVNAIRWPALACFFLTSGALATRWRARGWGKYMKGRFLRLMTPFFFINLLMLAPRYVAARALGSKFRLSLSWLALSFLNPHGQGIMPHLWYLPTLFICAALLPLIDLSAWRSRAVRVATGAALLALSAWPVTLPTLLCLNEIKLYLFWYWLGYALSATRGLDCPVPRKYAPLVGVAGLAVFLSALAMADGPLTPAAFMAGGAALLVSLSALGGLPAWAAWLSPRGFTIYLLSLCAQNLVEAVGYGVGCPWALTAAAMLVVGLTVPCLVYALGGKIKSASPAANLLRLIVGMKTL